MADLEKLVRERPRRSVLQQMQEGWCGRKWPGAILLLIAVLSLFIYRDGYYASAIFIIPGLIAAGEIMSHALRTERMKGVQMAKLLLFDIVVGMGAGVGLLYVPYGRPIIAIVAAATFCNDIGAQVCGKTWGWVCQRLGHDEPAKIFPETSPNKTWVGTWAGLIVGTAAGVATTHLANVYWTPLPQWILVIVLITPPLAVWGDWIESRTKRELPTKDFSQILGKTGGFCDRIDAIAPALTGALVVVLVQLFVTWLLG